MIKNNIIPLPIPIEENLLNSLTHINRMEEYIFNRLDALGKAAEKVLTKYPPPKLEIQITPQGNRELVFISEEIIIKDNRDLISGLSLKQTEVLEVVLKKMQQDRIQNAAWRKKFSDSDLLNFAYMQATSSHIANLIDLKRDIALLKMPLGFAVIALTEEASRFWNIYEKRDTEDSPSHRINGLYISGNNTSLPTMGRFIYINAYDANKNNSEINKTLMHEYLHLLHENYIKPFELPDPSTNRRKSRARYFGYQGSIAENRFNCIRNELIAYTYGDNNIPRDIDALLPVGLTYERALLDIEEFNKDDAERFKLGLQTLYSIFQIMADMPDNIRIKPREISYIILTSQDFHSMAKRIALLIKARYDNI